MIHWRKLFVALAAPVILAVAMPAWAQNTVDQPAADSTQVPDDTNKPKQESRRWTLVPAFNVYMPTDSRTKDTFGNNWFSCGLALSMKSNNAQPGRLEIHLDGAASRGDGRRAYVLPLGIGYAHRLTKPKPVSTYVGACANLYVMKLRSDYDNVDTGWCGRGGASLLFGVNVNSKVNVQLSYYAIPKLDSFDLSGMNLSAHVMF